MKKIFPCLWFDNNALEAAEFYTNIIPSSTIKSKNPVVVIFEINGEKVMGLNGGKMYQLNPSISFFNYCKTEDEAYKIWNKLIEGGEAMIAIGKQEWSECYGWLKDKYGLTWQISVVPDNMTKPVLKPSFLFTGEKFGRAEEAEDFYMSIFKDSERKLLMHYDENSPYNGKVLYSEFSLGGNDLIAMDGPGTHNFTFNEAFSFVIECKDQQDIDYYWESLSRGGKEDRCGWLKDKFGISWQVVPESMGKLMSDPEKGKRVMDRLLTMKKLNIEELENA